MCYSRYFGSRGAGYWVERGVGVGGRFVAGGNPAVDGTLGVVGVGCPVDYLWFFGSLQGDLRVDPGFVVVVSPGVKLVGGYLGDCDLSRGDCA